jgi:hypothetical protein
MEQGLPVGATISTVELNTNNVLGSGVPAEVRRPDSDIIVSFLIIKIMMLIA